MGFKEYERGRGTASEDCRRRERMSSDEQGRTGMSRDEQGRTRANEDKYGLSPEIYSSEGHCDSFQCLMPR
ncbi:unnamed protein product [Danaus chrysippus]|uniref:(African queen) hypothetical protein n=1 Tax=Danaus chrysippus TaxID=151541 RepID=A0A8J2R9A7_9NEOP|nr:unnamed protein product [Danaus chrysippus]